MSSIHQDILMNQNFSGRETLFTIIFYYAAILISAVLILFPSTRALPFAKLVVGILLGGLLIIFMRRENKRKTLKMTIPEVFNEARKGRKFSPPVIDTAATVATVLAFWLTCQHR